MNIESAGQEFYAAIKEHCAQMGRLRASWLPKWFSNKQKTSPEDILRVCAISAALVLQTSARQILWSPPDRSIAPSDYERLRETSTLAATQVPVEAVFLRHVAHAFCTSLHRSNEAPMRAPESNTNLQPYTAAVALNEKLWHMTRKLRWAETPTVCWKIAAQASGIALSESCERYGMPLIEAGVLYRKVFAEYLYMSPQKAQATDLLNKSTAAHSALTQG